MELSYNKRETFSATNYCMLFDESICILPSGFSLFYPSLMCSFQRECVCG